MSNRYAMVEGGIVVNVIIWDGNPESWSPPSGQQPVQIPSDSSTAIGWTYDGTNFEPPA